ncbi:uncharacterized protein C1683.06c-like [Ctenocephalides felis]|uniref:uncharacterized protein C1683.06c-like n=1 Tax=Ctenocephalides felis TaxID=7515 RepID=UPI000E6E3EAD|nr:uncharacterized protein C1683.06c-like [Ctenocephalides felis]
MAGRRRVIIDVDAGSDDAIALLMLIAAHKRGDVELMGITCVAGNTNVDNVAINVLRVLGAVKALDIPIYKGASEGLIPLDIPNSTESEFHGGDGFGDLEHYGNDPDLSLIKPENAVNYLISAAKQYENEITFIFVGPLTNAALAIKMYPGFLDKTKDVYIMGGNYKGVGNKTRAAEFNFVCDPEAAFLVLHNAKKPLHIVPWETCTSINLPLKWRFDVMGQINNAQMNLMNPIEKSIYGKYKTDFYYVCDAICVACFLYPDLVKNSYEVHATVELQGLYARGQMVLDHRKIFANLPNVLFVTDINLEMFKKMLLFAAGHENSGY